MSFMDINFTFWSTMMSGGVRAAFEIINGLSDLGHNLTVTALDGDHSWFPLKAEVTYVNPPRIFNVLNPFIRRRYRRPMSYTIINHVTRNIGMELNLVDKLASATSNCDVNVATWFPTAQAVINSNKGVPFYFFQDFDELARTESPKYYQIFRESLELPLHIITISTWLKEWIRDNYHKNASVCGDGINHNVFYQRERILDKSRPRIMGLFAELEYKGNSDLMEALNLLHDQIPDLELLAVSSKARIFNKVLSETPPSFDYTFYERPSDDLLAGLYSSADVFAFSSHVEGFGLPPLEAMACGCPVVTTDCLGVRDFVVDGDNSFMIDPKKPQLMAETIKNVLNNPDISSKFQENGLKTAAKFTWSKVSQRFEKTIIETLNGD